MLTKLKKLSLIDNKITELPSEFKTLKNLKELDLRMNLLSIPQDILGIIWEPNKIMEYYFQELSR